MFLLDTSLSACEVIGLDVHDVDAISGTATVRHRKGGAELSSSADGLAALCDGISSNAIPHPPLYLRRMRTSACAAWD